MKFSRPKFFWNVQNELKYYFQSVFNKPDDCIRSYCMKSGISANACRVWRPNATKILDKVLNNLFTKTNFQKKENNMEGEVSIK